MVLIKNNYNGITDLIFSKEFMMEVILSVLEN